MPSPKLCEDCKGLLGSNVIICLKHAVEEVLDGAVQLFVAMLLICCFDICKQSQNHSTTADVLRVNRGPTDSHVGDMVVLSSEYQQLCTQRSCSYSMFAFVHAVCSLAINNQEHLIRRMICLANTMSATSAAAKMCTNKK